MRTEQSFASRQQVNLSAKVFIANVAGFQDPSIHPVPSIDS